MYIVQMVHFGRKSARLKCFNHPIEFHFNQMNVCKYLQGIRVDSHAN